MKKIRSYVIVCMMAAAPLAAMAAAFEHDLFFGMRENADVITLQKFLRDQGLYDGPANGNFFSLTRQGVKAFQEKYGINPSRGYVGIKTRTKANALVREITPRSREDQTAALEAQIKAVQMQIADLIAKQQQAATTTPPVLSPSPSPIPTTTPVATTTPPAPISQLLISGSSTQPFPDQGKIPTKLGNITIANTTDRDILFNQFQLDIYDGMNSSTNRGKTVIFKLRNGTTTYDDLISQTNFDVNNDAPPPGGETRRQLNVSFPIIVKSGKTHVSSLWIESLDYVISGTLRVNMLTAYINNGVIPKGGFAFTLTRQ